MDKLAIHGGTPVRDKKISYGHQYIDDNDIEAVLNVLKSDFLTCGPKILELETKLCHITGAKYAVAVSNGTSALHGACQVAGIGMGDEVITTPMTFAASSNCILYCEATPVFADICPDTYNIDPKDIEKKITDKTKAVVAVDFTGQAVQMDEIKDICRRHNLILIEDGAHSIGTRYKNIPVGGIADLTTFSFHPVKTVTGGEGGVILTNNETYYEKLLLFRSHGISRDEHIMSKESEGAWYYEQIDLGYNLRMTDMQAALICSQLDKLDRFKQRRQEIVAYYNKVFEMIPEIIVQKEIDESDTVRHLYIIQLVLEKLNATRKQIFDALAAENVCCNVHYIPVYYFPYYQKLGYKKGLCPYAEKLYDSEITIPLFYGMTDEDVQDVVKAIRKVIRYYSKG